MRRKKRKTKDHEERLREINDSLRKINLHLIGVLRVPKGTEGQIMYLNKS